MGSGRKICIVSYGPKTTKAVVKEFKSPMNHCHVTHRLGTEWENRNCAKTNWTTFASESTEVFVWFVFCFFSDLLRDISWMQEAKFVSAKFVYCVSKLESIYISSTECYPYNITDMLSYLERWPWNSRMPYFLIGPWQCILQCDFPQRTRLET